MQVGKLHLILLFTVIAAANLYADYSDVLVKQTSNYMISTDTKLIQAIEHEGLQSYSRKRDEYSFAIDIQGKYTAGIFGYKVSGKIDVHQLAPGYYLLSPSFEQTNTMGENKAYSGLWNKILGNLDNYIVIRQPAYSDTIKMLDSIMLYAEKYFSTIHSSEIDSLSHLVDSGVFRTATSERTLLMQQKDELYKQIAEVDSYMVVGSVKSRNKKYVVLLGQAISSKNQQNVLAERHTLHVYDFQNTDFLTLDYFQGKDFMLIDQKPGVNAYGATDIIYIFGKHLPTSMVDKNNSINTAIDAVDRKIAKDDSILVPLDELNDIKTIQYSKIKLYESDFYFGGAIIDHKLGKLVPHGDGVLLSYDHQLSRGKWDRGKRLR